MSDLPVVCVFGVENVCLRSWGPVPEFETRDIDTRCFSSDRDLKKILAHHRPVGLVSIGSLEQFAELHKLPFDLRRRWVHFDSAEDLDRVGQAAFMSLITDVTVPRPAPPLVTVFTPAFRTGERIQRPLQSLLRQSYTDWEWIVMDDSDDGGVTFGEITHLARQDHRIGVFKSHRHSGVIGEVKRQAARLGRGSILVELDHDDELTPTALSSIVEAFERYPEAGFCYSDCAEVFETGGNASYTNGWGFGYGHTYATLHEGRELWPHRAPLPNAKTIRHIVSAPNHFRAWRTKTYEEIGGHSPLLHVADDYELCVRTFLATRMVQIRRLGYIQYYNSTGNTQRTRNKDIQRLVRYIQHAYDRRIHDRLIELGADDFVWDEALQCSDFSRPNPEAESHCGLILE